MVSSTSPQSKFIRKNHFNRARRTPPVAPQPTPPTTAPGSPSFIPIPALSVDEEAAHIQQSESIESLADDHASPRSLLSLPSSSLPSHGNLLALVITPMNTNPDTSQLKGNKVAASNKKPAGLTNPPGAGPLQPQIYKAPDQGLSCAIKVKWNKKKGTKAWVFLHSPRHKPNNQEKHNKAKALIGKIMHRDIGDFTLSQPIADTSNDKPPINSAYPHCYLLSAPEDPSIVDSVLNFGPLVSTEEIMLHICPFAPSNPKFIGTVQHFNLTSSKADTEIVETHVRKHIRGQANIRATLDMHSTTKDPKEQDQIVNSITAVPFSINTSRSSQMLLWNIYF
ncbi:hypothetical protein CONPUDRAFT_74643 [Coniophora puteana RWD-64-598 SS2]|uniref:Uncharacterized protein n=1 Tax=Coniophora puteana (strain RWD-64-598) TaxID=741705 RepID=A0A5M3MKF9_CONPW|nr:uncharacterized protein CONPUDRAFT_74643 [Coniophora puteana RWD-64-598 SS2]EIW79135.1 hypothetical protein CONPUDRAFT_74643 [Coniophora puteana RWD-64-598 SS2]